MGFSRRSFLGASTSAYVGSTSLLAMLSTVGGQVQAATRVKPLVGSITGNDPNGYQRFAGYFGRKPELALLAFNQSSVSAMASSVDWICQQGAAFQANGAQILWSVPCPGGWQLEAIVNGTHDALYLDVFNTILEVSPTGSGPIYVRLPWEFNIAGQENAAIDRGGNWNGPLFAQAFRRIAAIARQVSPRFQRIWCPNVTTMSLDPATCWPGKRYVDIVAQDFYLKAAWNQPGAFAWFRSEARGLDWGARYAKRKGKPYGLSEFGMDNDIFKADLDAAAAWFLGLGSLAHHQCWWDRWEVDDCRISDGSHPALATSYRTNFY